MTTPYATTLSGIKKPWAPMVHQYASTSRSLGRVSAPCSACKLTLVASDNSCPRCGEQIKKDNDEQQTPTPCST